MASEEVLEQICENSSEGFKAEHPDLERVSLINKIVSDCCDGYCTARMVVSKSKNSPLKETDPNKCLGGYEKNCKGHGWCKYREQIYHGPMRARTLIQIKLIEARKYLDDLHNKKDESWTEADQHWADFINGAMEVFRYAYDDLGIRDLNALKILCVDSVVDNPARLEKCQPNA